MKFYLHKGKSVGCVSYSARVPGSLMLFGEHAVLYNKRAIVTAVNHYIKVTLTPRFDRNIELFFLLYR